MSDHNSTRRSFLQAVSAGAFVAPWIRSAPLGAALANEKVNIGCVGVGGKGLSDMLETSAGHNIVAVCDVNEGSLSRAMQEFPAARQYADWRQLLEQSDIDAVTVSTPDHTHAAVTASAMNLGKHVYTQKPLTHDVYEARRLREIAVERGVVTQMGIQHHATRRLKLAVHAIQDGAIGPVSEVHTWTDRPGRWWRQGLDRPGRTDDVPPHLDWDLWLGTAPERPYVEGPYHPFHWRGWWDFGTGALGDMGCHILDPVIGALRLGPPRSVQSVGPKPHTESGPQWCLVQWEFPGTTRTTETVRVNWYEAGIQPARELFLAPDDWAGSQNGVLFIGEQGNLFVGFPEMPELFPRDRFSSYEWPEVEDHNHYQEWTTAIATGGETSCPFSYSGPLTETVLLGNVAYRLGRTILWDSERLRATDDAEADQYLRRQYRAGWEVDGLS